jgi:predicted RNA-binding protein with PIN domain
VIYLVDGSNLLGRAGADREGNEEKRALLRSTASFARRESAKLVLYFDGARPDDFAVHLGAVQAQFSGARAADELIVERARRAAEREPVRVVTSDGALAARVRGRRVEVVSCADFLQRLDERESGEVPESDWERYFSDPKNRENF